MIALIIINVNTRGGQPEKKMGQSVNFCPEGERIVGESEGNQPISQLSSIQSASVRNGAKNSPMTMDQV